MRHPFDGIIGQAPGESLAQESAADKPATAPIGLTRRSLLGRVAAVIAALFGVPAVFAQQRLPAGSARQRNSSGSRMTTRWYWEEGRQTGPRPSSHVYYEDGGRAPTTTLALGEAGGRKPASRPTTRALGEEGGQKRPVQKSSPRSPTTLPRRP